MSVAALLSPLLMGLVLASPVAAIAEDADDAHPSREGDATLFMELFAHLEPHAVSAMWFGGSKGFGFVDPHVYDAAGQPVLDDHDNPSVFHTSAELREHYTAELGGGWGFLIYNINTVMWIACLALLAVFVPVARRSTALAGNAPKGGVFGMLEAFVLFVRDEMVYGVMGKQAGRRFVPLFLTQFFFIFFMNVLGLIPLGGIGGTATANLAVTAALAATSLLWIHMSGMREHGFTKHWKNFIPNVPGFVLPVIVPVEILGMIVKPFALTLRLFANLTAGHLVVLGLFGLVYFFNSGVIAAPVMAMAIGIYCLELFFCLVQAYIFTYLSIVFVGASVHPEH